LEESASLTLLTPDLQGVIPSFHESPQSLLIHSTILSISAPSLPFSLSKLWTPTLCIHFITLRETPLPERLIFTDEGSCLSTNAPHPSDLDLITHFKDPESLENQGETNE